MDSNEAENRSDSKMPVKKEYIPLGTTIHEEQPFVYVLSSKFRTECCDFCFKKWAQLSKCSACKYVYYCGKACQKQGWMVHKYECHNLKKIAPRILPDAARMLFRIHKKMQTGGAACKTCYTKGQYRMWKDLMSHYPELKKDARRMEHLSSLYAVLTEFFQEELGPNFVEMMELYGRMCINSFNICNQELQSLGTGIYLGASIFDHSCHPNALAIFEGTTLIIRTLYALPEVDLSKIRISYIDVLASTEERQKELLDAYYFLCDCPKCLLAEDRTELFGAQCQNTACKSAVCCEKAKCDKCGKELTQKFINEFRSVVELTENHLATMKDMTCLDVCKICLKKHKGVLYKHHLRHIKTLDLAFEASIDLGKFDDALQYGLELAECYEKRYPTIHPLTGLLHLKLAKLLMNERKVRECVRHLRQASDILKVTHSSTSSLYKTEVFPLIQQCKLMNGIKRT
ncbi:histone-lysine N-methyltransferase SMYD3 isoform X1 [Dendroctonus ponderosae]|uniref:MYND-type domain-containing protein n=2 Tax=Dendroctonus ponderosae TaxID=77166 RepID=U4U294_DENPD|nr:histone-lysine N-methyltransferase SMYD3 isoform X1 [Dendroctonus ponderosae]ERL87192.1 hypothetical protein D910_04592 [Dendroctonus ponderosae]KAH1012277.1 hypothetical protein HUJ05_011460 [Dendroctonus ponderosae]